MRNCFKLLLHSKLSLSKYLFSQVFTVSVSIPSKNSAPLFQILILFRGYPTTVPGYELCTMRPRCFGSCISYSIVCGSKGTEAAQLSKGYLNSRITWLNMVSVLIISVRTTMPLDILEHFGAPNSNGITFVHNFLSRDPVTYETSGRDAEFDVG